MARSGQPGCWWFCGVPAQGLLSAQLKALRRSSALPVPQNSACWEDQCQQQSGKSALPQGPVSMESCLWSWSPCGGALAFWGWAHLCTLGAACALSKTQDLGWGGQARGSQLLDEGDGMCNEFLWF